MKRIIEKIIKVLNIIGNMIFGMVAITDGVAYGTNAYLWSDTWMRIVWIAIMFVTFNAADYFIKKTIKDF